MINRLPRWRPWGLISIQNFRSGVQLNKLIVSRDPIDRVVAIDISPDNRQLAAWCDSGIAVIDRQSFKVIRHFARWNRYAPLTPSVSASHDGKYIVATLWWTNAGYYFPVHRQPWLRCLPLLVVGLIYVLLMSSSSKKQKATIRQMHQFRGIDVAGAFITIHCHWT